MADIGFANSVLNKLTKKMYENGVVGQMIVGAPFMKNVGKVNIDLGTDMTFAIGTSWAEGIGNRTDRQPLPEAQAPDFLNPSYDTVDTYQTLEITGKEIERTKGSTVALANYLDELMQGAEKNFWRDKEWEAFNDASGLRGLTSGDTVAGAAVTITLAAAYVPTRGLRVNMKIDLYNDGNGMKYTDCRITSVDSVAGTIVVDVLDQDIPTGSSIYMSGNRNNEINGLLNLVNNSAGAATVLGISSTNALWQSQVLTNSGNARNLTQDLLDKLFFLINNQNDEDPSEVWMDKVTQMVKWIGMVNRNFQVNGTGPSVKINAHNEVTEFGSAKIHTSSMAPNNKIYMLQGNDIKLRVARQYKPITEDKAQNIWQLRDNYNLFQCKMWAAMQLVCKSRRLHGFIGDLATS